MFSFTNNSSNLIRKPSSGHRLPSAGKLMAIAMVTVLVLVMAMFGSASAAILYDESVSGDLGNIFSPTNLGVLGAGSYTVIGTGTGSSPAKRDFFSFDVGSGLEVTDFTLDSVSQSGTTSFALYR